MQALLALGEFLKTEESFEKRLHRVIKLKIQLAEKHKSLSRALFRVAANPLSPLSPFGEETRQIRLEAFEAFEQIVHGAVEKIHPDLKQVLPEYLWMYQMGIILFWIYDQSEESKRTYQLIDQSIPLIVFLLKKLQSPLAAPIRKKVLTIMRNFKGNLMDKDTQLVSKKERKK